MDDLATLPSTSVDPETCVHRWLMEAPKGETVHGVCSRCGKEREDPASLNLVGSGGDSARFDSHDCPVCGSKVPGAGNGKCGACRQSKPGAEEAKAAAAMAERSGGFVGGKYHRTCVDCGTAFTAGSPASKRCPPCRHGTTAEYAHGCRCDRCKAAVSDAAKAVARRKKEGADAGAVDAVVDAPVPEAAALVVAAGADAPGGALDARGDAPERAAAAEAPAAVGPVERPWAGAIAVLMAELGGLQTRVGDLECNLRELAESPPPADGAPAMAQVKSELAAVSAVELGDVMRVAGMDAIRLREVSEELVLTGTELTRLTDRVEALERRLDELARLDRAVERVVAERPPPVRYEGVEAGKLAEIEQRLDDLGHLVSWTGQAVEKSLVALRERYLGVLITAFERDPMQWRITAIERRLWP